MAKHIAIVLSNAKDGADAAFNEWYTNTHIREVLAVDGFSAAQRFKLSETQISPAPGSHQYLALYEIETDDLQALQAAIREASPNMQMSDAFDGAGAVMMLFTPVTERVTAEQVAAQAR